MSRFSVAFRQKRAPWLQLASWILLPLELALGADLIRTAIAPTWDDIGKLGAIAAVASNNRTTVIVSPGTTVTALPSGCVATVVGSMTYQRCGSVWYQPRFAGSTVEYVVVTAP